MRHIHSLTHFTQKRRASGRNRLPDACALEAQHRFGAKYEKVLSARLGQRFLNDGRRIRCGAVQIPVHRALVASETGEFKFAPLGHDSNVHGSVKTGSWRYGALPDQFQQAQVTQMAENVRASCPRNLTILSSPERFEYGFV